MFSETEACPIEKIIEGDSILTLFQPLVSVRKKRVIGHEALSRGIFGSSGNIIMPRALFEAAQAAGSVLDLDREQYVLCVDFKHDRDIA
ncbi:MAG: EAL domain-containing protein [Spirochaetes bacterium]|nr:EAL domain-containing protein [Spirochaetota bacterium]